METIDYLVVGLYFVLVFGIAIYVSRKKGSGQDSSDYFLGGRNLGWFAIGASLFASNIGSEHLIGLSGAGARGAFAEAQFEILASLILLLLGWVFVPFYIKSGVFTMPEFLEKRYNSGSRVYLSVVSIVSYVLTKISFTIFAGALVFEILLGIPFWTGAIIVVVATGIYTAFGGLRAVIYTDLIQSFIFIFGGIAVTYFALDAIGGWDNALTAIKNSGHQSSETFLNFWNNENYPWTGVLIGAPILGVWYWCTDQFIVQRVLSAKNIEVARKGTIFGSFLKLLPLFIFVIPGVLAFALSQEIYPDLFKIENPISGEINETTDAALPALILKILPVGFKGLVVAGFLAALMSSLSSVFNSTSTLFTIDFYKKWYPESSEKRLVMVGRLGTIALVIVGLLWIPFMKKLTEGGGLYKYLQSVQAYISPPIAAAFILGIFYKRINGKGALVSLWTGFVLGIGRLVLEFATEVNGLKIPDNSLLGHLVTMNFLHYAIFLFVLCSSILIIVSLATSTSAPEKSSELTYSTDGERRPFSEVVKSWEFLLTILVVIIVLILWWVFS